MLHSFHERLAYSLEASHEPFWCDVYRKAFPEMREMTLEKAIAQQRAGVDRLVRLKCGRVLKIDEKKRDTVYPDILLEYVSNTETNAPGWAVKPLTVDYIAYAFMPTQRVYFLDYLMLKRCWAHYGEMWLMQHKHVTARTITADGVYRTLSVAVPIDILRGALSAAAIIQLDW